MKSPKLSALLSALLLFSTSGICDSSFEGKQADVNRQPLGLYAGQVSALQMSSNGTLYAGLNSPNGIFCSTDRAATWQPPPAGVNLGNVVALAMGETPDTIYLLGGILLFKSSDACHSFVELSGVRGPGANDYSWGLAYGHNTLLVGNRNGTVDRSTDNGATFSNVHVADGVTNIRAIAASPKTGRFFALGQTATTMKVFKSGDAGATWSDTGESGNFDRLAVEPVSGDIVIAMSQNQVDISQNDGDTFSLMTLNGAQSSGNIDFITMPDQTRRIYIGSRWTADLGTTWHEMNADIASRGSRLDGHLVQDVSDPITFYAVSERGVAKSTDTQANWTDKVEGMLGLQIFSLAQGSNKDNFYIGTRYGYAKTTNYTSTNPTWQYPLTLAGNQVMADPQIMAMAIDPADDNHLLASDNISGLYFSTNGGETWSAATVPPLSNHARMTSIKFGASGSNTAYAGYCDDNRTGGVLTSTDNGQTWTDSPVTNTPCVNSLLFRGGALFAGVGYEFDNTASRRGIYKLADGTWAQLGGGIEGAMVKDVTANATSLFAAAGDTHQGGLFRSDDNGSTWINLSGTMESSRCTRSVAVDPARQNVIYTATGCPSGNGAIFRSEDNGNSWTLHYQGLRDEVPLVLLVDDLVAGLNTGAYKFDRVAAPKLYTISASLAKNGNRRILKGTVKNLKKKPVKNLQVIPLYRSKATGAFKRFASIQKTNKSGVVQWNATRKGYYELQLKSDRRVTSKMLRFR